MENRPHKNLLRHPSGAVSAGCLSGATAAARHSSGATLLVFTLGARCESRRRKLLPVTQKSVEDSLHQACLDATLAAGRAAGLRLEVSSPLELTLPADVDRRRQIGPDFGSRLSSAVERTFAEQDGPVVLVGSDVPDLEARHLRRTLEILDEDADSVVIGPSPDGGFYLLAAARPLAAALSQVQWRCRRTLRSLKRALRRQGRKVVLLAPLADLDRRADLERWLASSPAAAAASLGYDETGCGALWRVLIERLAEILAGLRQALAVELPPASPRCQSRAHRLRGPPSPASSRLRIATG